MTPEVRTDIVGFTEEEWGLIRLSAKAVADQDGDAATLILPDRPGLYRLDRVGGNTFRLRLSTEDEFAETVLGEERQ